MSLKVIHTARLKTVAAIVIVVALLACHVCLAQPAELSFNQLNSTNGLLQGNVNKIFKDSRGFVWVLTAGAINRFDGMECLANEAIAPGLQQFTTAKNIIEDKNGDIWIDNINSGVVQYDWRQQRFNQIIIPEKKEATARKSFRLLFYDGNEQLALGNESDSSFLLYNISTKKFSTAFLPCMATTINCWLDKINTNNPSIKLIARVSNSLQEYNGKLQPGGQIAWGEKRTLVAENLALGSYFDLVQDDCWFSIGKEIHQVNVANGIDKLMATLPNEQAWIIGLFVSPDNHLWICTSSAGLYVYNISDGKMIAHYQNNPLDKTSVAANYIASILIDNENNLWVGTWGHGVSYCNLQNQRLLQKFSNTAASYYKADNFIRGIAKGSSNDYWCITLFGGIVHLDSSFNYIGKLKGYENYLSEFMLADKAGFWFGGPVLYHFNTFSNSITAYKLPIKKSITTACHLADGRLLLAINELGLICFNPATGVYSPLPEIEDAKKSHISIFEDSQLQLYNCPFFSGFTVYQKENTIYKKVFSLVEKIDVKHIFQADNHTVWISSSGGLLLFDPITLQIKKRFSSKEGLADNTVYAAATDKMNRIWLGTNKGISQISLANGSIRNYTPDDGIQGYEFNSGVVYTTTDGRLVFGGTNGLNIINPGLQKQNKNIPVIQITSVKAAAAIAPALFENGKTLELAASNNNIEIACIAIEYSSATENKLKYRLTGFDKDWVMAKNKTIAKYTNLPAGHYSFEVMAANADGEWTLQPKQIQIYIQKFWWQTWWCRILTFALLFCFLLISIQLYLKRKVKEQQDAIERKFAVEQAERNERQRIAADLHDNIGAQLSYITSNIDWMLNRPGTKDAADEQRRLEDINATAKHSINDFRETIWALKKNEISLQELSDRLKTFALHFSANRQPPVVVSFEDSISKNNILPANEALHLFRICQEAFNNAIKHAGVANIVISIKSSTTCLYEVNITDNGAGFDTSQQLQGHYGLENMQTRAKEINALFRLSSEKDKGTVVLIQKLLI